MRKSEKRMRREDIIIHEGNTKKAGDRIQFLTNDENKKQLIQVLQDEWNKDDMAKKLQGRKMIFIWEGAAYLLTSPDGKQVT